ncbi:thioredoxin family protein [Pseudomonas sp. PSKL.D1]|uniref:thioredoxin family protein n=1 Tax=Pseudomonas sp. PSKL.D1 TaxID=3029060 RepID=UPI0023812D2D|nr:thioredoxin family protein [Pseudomonas sp. PSKL.D1]WDY56135.1 thioredoxin family protein [Pseudomonas sp. PSKL.D1]
MTIDRRLLKAGGVALALVGLGLAGHLMARDSYGPMPALSGASEWINSPPLDAPELKGKVVLVDFWTWDCINCKRSLPHVNEWARRYADQGLVVVGVHTPEYDYEHDVGQLKHKVASLGIGYPVAVDNDYAVWNAWGNQFWPAHYFVDRQGQVRHVHFGEGDYAGQEKVIQELLGEKG